MIAPGNNIKKEKEFIRSIFDSLQKKPVIHIFVFEQELLTNAVVKELVDEKYINVIGYNDFLPAEVFKTQYAETFVDFYNFMNGENIDKVFDVITKHRSKKNMGEIHSLILAHYMEIPIFMSNDNGAKNLAKSKINTLSFTITVMNVCEVFCEIKRNGVIQIDKKAVRSILKQRRTWFDIYNNLEK
jgi:predicted nucleic acid-binding protein